MARRKQDKFITEVELNSNARTARQRLRSFGNPEQAAILARFFKAGPGQYGEGDRFIGVKVPATRKVAREFGNLPPTSNACCTPKSMRSGCSPW